MTYARFEQEGSVSFGIVDKGVVREIRGAPWETAAGAATETGRSFPLPKVRLLPPCAPSKIFALAFNYVDHLHGRQYPAEPQIFLKVPSATIGPEETIVLPPHAGEELPGGPGRVDEEGELVVVMGSRCRGVSRAQAMRHVFGYTCGNDVSARAWQKNDLNWWRAKSSDTFAAFGPFIATSIDPQDVLDRLADQRQGGAALLAARSHLRHPVPDRVDLAVGHPRAGRPHLHGHLGRARGASPGGRRGSADRGNRGASKPRPPRIGREPELPRSSSACAVPGSSIEWCGSCSSTRGRGSPIARSRPGRAGRTIRPRRG